MRTRAIRSRAVEAERERLLRALNVECARLEEVFRQSPSFLAVLRAPEWTFELVNDAYYQVVGDREVVGRRLSEALPEVMDQGLVELLEEVVRTGEPYVGRELPIILQRDAGKPEERFLDFVYQPLTDNRRQPGGSGGTRP